MSQSGGNEITMTSLINNKFRITRRIGGGSFGEIYMGVGPLNEKVAIKFERHGSRCPQLRHEYKVYRELVSCHGFCRVHYFGMQDNYNVMVMDLLGPSLEDLFNKCNRRLTLKTVLQLADQLLERVDTLHTNHLIHRDIKPANFVVGLSEQSPVVYCVDFGLSKRYRHPKTLQHIPHRDGRSLTGTPRYASINNHLGIEQSRRDDLESIGYVLVYFLKGTLPWQGLKAKNAQRKYRLILEKKQQISIAQLCQGCPSQFAEFLAYSRSLKFDAKPDMPYLRKLFRDLFTSQGYNNNSGGKMWDWDAVDVDTFTNSLGGGNPSTSAAPMLSQTGAFTNQAARADPLDDGLGDNYGGENRFTSSGIGFNNNAGDLKRPMTSPSAPSAPAPLMNTNTTNTGTRAITTPSWGFGSRAGGMDGGNTMNFNSSGGGGGGIPMKPPMPSNTLSSGTGLLHKRDSGNNFSSDGKGSLFPSTNIGSSSPGPAANSSTNVNSSSNSSQKRPHTAHGPSRGGVSGPPVSAVATDGRKPEGDNVEDDAHVVAGARAMMRYRRTKPGPEPTPNPTPAVGRSWGYGVGNTSNINSSAPPLVNTPSGSNLVGTRASYQNPSNRPLLTTAAAPNGSTPAVRKGSAGPTPMLNQSQGWTSSSNNNGSAAGMDSRPKSAGLGISGILGGAKEASAGKGKTNTKMFSLSRY